VLRSGDRAQPDVPAVGPGGETDLGGRFPGERARGEAGHGRGRVGAVAAGQRDRAVGGGLDRGLVRGGLQLQPHRQRDLQDVAGQPDPVHREPAAGPGGDVQRGPVQPGLGRPRHPGRDPHPHRHPGQAAGHLDPGSRLVREAGRLAQRDRAVGTGHLGRHEQVDVDAAVIARVDGVGELGLGLHPGAGVTGERAVVGGVDVRITVREVVQRLLLERARGKAGVVDVEAVPRVRVLFAEHLVEQRPLVVVQQVGAVLLVKVQQPGQLQQVVGDAVLAGVVGQRGRDDARRAEVLVIADPADDVAVVPDHHLPEIHGDGVIAVVPGLFPQPQERGDLRGGRVGLQAGQPVLPAGHRVQHPGVVEPLGGDQVLVVAGDRVQVGQ
jgi:hypothetical protein